MFRILQATVNDVSTICDIGSRAFTDAYAEFNTKADLEEYLTHSFSPEVIKEELLNPDTGYYLCFKDDVVIGYLKLNFNKGCEAFEEKNVAELQRIYVLKEFYRHKTGTFIMQFAIDTCKEKNYEYLWLGVWKENHRALSFYRYWGFETIGERNFQVGTKQYDDYYLRKKLH